LITGGLGFIGSNLARRLVALGADVCLVDALISGLGGNRFNIDGISGQVRVEVADLRDQRAMAPLVADRELVFNLAGNVSHVDSMRDPLADFEINARSHLMLLDVCRHHNPHAKIVYAGTRQIYGRPERLPVGEDHPIRPVDVNGASKAVAEYYHLVYHEGFGLRTCSLRLTNVYGPRQLIRHPRLGFIGWFIRLAVEGRDVTVYGDGSQLRDFVYVDDVVDAFLRAGASDACNGRVFNVGGSQPISLRALAELLVEIAGTGQVRLVEWPADRKAIDIGSFYTDWTRFRDTAGWQPRRDLRDGLARTISYYRDHLSHYVELVPDSAAHP